VKSLFCSVCGDQNVNLVDALCYKCYWKANVSATVKTNNVDINICIECGAVHLPNGWTGPNNPESIPNILKNYTRKWIKTSSENEVQSELLSEIDWDDGKPQVDVELTIRDSSIKSFPVHEEKHNVHVNFLWSTCSSCAKRKTGGDATLQFRAIDRWITSEEKTMIENIFRKIIERIGDDNNLAFVSDVVETHMGYNYKLGSNVLAELAIQELKKQMVGKIDKSYRLVGEDKDGTRRYQTTYLYKLPCVVNDDYVEFEGELTRVVTVTNTGVVLHKFKTGTRELVKKWEDLRPVDPAPNLITYIVTSKDYELNTYELMNMKTYESFEIQGDDFPQELPTGEEVTFIESKGILYLKT
jgi:nonsense-mediated mRNA decay protein 3